VTETHGCRFGVVSQPWKASTVESSTALYISSGPVRGKSPKRPAGNARQSDAVAPVNRAGQRPKMRRSGVRSSCRERAEGRSSSSPIG